MNKTVKTIRGKGKPSGSARIRLSVWTLAGFLLPAAALVYLIIWSQTSEPLSAQTEIMRAARSLEVLVREGLDLTKADAARWAGGRPLDPSAGPAGMFRDSLPFAFGIDEEGRPLVTEPPPSAAKQVWALPGDEMRRKTYETFSREAEECEIIRKDITRAEEIFDVMAKNFTEPAYRVRTKLARAAFLVHQGRNGEAVTELVEVISETDPAAAPGPGELPFVVSAFLLLDENAGGHSIEPARAAAVGVMTGGSTPLKAAELRAVTERLKTVSDEERDALLRRVRALDVIEALEGMSETREKMRGAEGFALVTRNKLWLGDTSQGIVRGVACPAEEGLAALLEAEFPAGAGARAGSGLEAFLVVDESGSGGEEGEVIRFLPSPAGIDGAVLKIVLADRTVFEESARSRRVFVVGAGVLLFLALIVLGFATFRAVRREVEAAKARSDFMASVSHELRTPLASIRTFTELLEEGRVAEEGKKQRFLRLILSNCRRLTAMVENVLDLSRSEQGLLRFHVEEVDLKSLLDDLFRDISAAAGEDGFAVEVAIAGDVPDVRADPTALARAVFNICDNARKYSGEEKRIEVKAVKKAGGALITISDSGPGIADEEREKVFERFNRGSRDRAVSGVGLGLSLAREAVEACSGRLELESGEGRGAVFSIFLPALESEPVEDGGEG